MSNKLTKKIIYRRINKIEKLGYILGDEEREALDDNYYPIVFCFSKIETVSPYKGAQSTYKHYVDISQKHQYNGYVGSALWSYTDGNGVCNLKFEELKEFYKLSKIMYRIAKRKKSEFYKLKVEVE